MKGTPETPQCGFSRASIQILSLQGVDPTKFAAFNVLEDQELRQGWFSNFHSVVRACEEAQLHSRLKGILRLANDTAALCAEGICRWM